MSETKQPIFANVHKETQAMPSYTMIQASSPWKDADVSFNYVKVDYPKFHTHNHWELLIVLSGTVVHEINKESYTMKKGEACFIRPQDKHHLIKSTSSGQEAYKHLNFLISSDFMQSTLQSIDKSLCKKLLNIPSSLSFSIKPDFLQNITRKTICMQSHTPPSSVDFSRCKLIILELLSHYLEEYFYHKPPYPDWFSDFLLLLQDVKRFTLPIADLAKFSPYSYSRLSHIFKDLMGISLVDYITTLKLNYSKALLKNSALPITEIAAECQWTLTHFNKIFKQKTGTTPGKYRSLKSSLKNQN